MYRTTKTKSKVWRKISRASAGTQWWASYFLKVTALLYFRY
jgi:hypothetical protein